MGFSIEALNPNERHFLLRVGPKHTGLNGSPWVAAALLSVRVGRKVGLLRAMCLLPKELAPDNEVTEFTTSLYRDFYQATKHLGVVPEWWRSNGEAVPMTKRTIPDHKEAIGADGAIDQGLVGQHAQVVLSQFAAGHQILHSMDKVDTGEKNDKGAPIYEWRFRVSETDPSVAAEDAPATAAA